jgi:predicted GNAT family acetyltransferase
MHLINRITPEVLNVCMTFEKCHPKEVQWPKKGKLDYLEDEETHAYWLVNDQDIVIGEALFHHKSDSCAEIDSYTILPEHQGKGLGRKMIELGIVEMKSMGYRYLSGEARGGASINTFLAMGAQIVCPQENYGNTKETYYSFKLDI